MTSTRQQRFPIGASVTRHDLEHSPYERLAALRRDEPVSWVPAINAWLVTRRDLAVSAMRDAEAFTVDDDRFTTAAVLGDSMLSLDGPEHERHRTPFAPSFRPGILREQFDDFLATNAAALVAAAFVDGAAELRTGLAGPLAVNTITRFLGLANVTPDEVLGWYQSIATAITDLTITGQVADDDRAAVAQIHQRVRVALDSADNTTLLTRIEQDGFLRHDEMAPAALVLMFGAIETAEGMTANALWHLLDQPSAWAQVRHDRSLIAPAIEESLRLEPAAAVVDRYATRDVELGGVTIPKGDLVTLSLLASNRDPSVFERPDDFDLSRNNLRQHVTFVQGPHACIGLHLARMETAAAINAVLDAHPDLELDRGRSQAPAGLIFRKPAALRVTSHTAPNST